MTLSRSFYSTETTAYDYLQARAPRSLWAAVLEQAITDAVSGPSALDVSKMTAVEALEFDASIRAAAKEWIADQENEPRRFLWVCEQLGMDPTAVRKEVTRRLHGK